MSNLVTLNQFVPTAFSKKGKKYLIISLEWYNTNKATGSDQITDFKGNSDALEAWFNDATKNAIVCFNNVTQKFEMLGASVEIGKLLNGNVCSVSFDFEHFEFEVMDIGEV